MLQIRRRRVVRWLVCVRPWSQFRWSPISRWLTLKCQDPTRSWSRHLRLLFWRQDKSRPLSTVTSKINRRAAPTENLSKLMTTRTRDRRRRLSIENQFVNLLRQGWAYPVASWERLRRPVSATIPCLLMRTFHKACSVTKTTIGISRGWVRLSSESVTHSCHKSATPRTLRQQGSEKLGRVILLEGTLLQRWTKA